MNKLSRTPYLLRAIYDWMLDSALTPHLIVDAGVAGVSIPREFVSDGRLVLNISPSATAGLSIGATELTFSARFGGVARELHIPVAAVQAIYARENGEGMMFSADDPETVPEEEVAAPARPALRVVD